MNNDESKTTTAGPAGLFSIFNVYKRNADGTDGEPVTDCVVLRGSVPEDLVAMVGYACSLAEPYEDLSSQLADFVCDKIRKMSKLEQNIFATSFDMTNAMFFEAGVEIMKEAKRE